MKPGDYPTKMLGRPRVEVRREEVVATRLPTAIYDRLVRVASAQDRSVSALVRSLIILRLPKD